MSPKNHFALLSLNLVILAWYFYPKLICLLNLLWFLGKVIKLSKSLKWLKWILNKINRLKWPKFQIKMTKMIFEQSYQTKIINSNFSGPK